MHIDTLSVILNFQGGKDDVNKAATDNHKKSEKTCSTISKPAKSAKKKVYRMRCP